MSYYAVDLVGKEKGDEQPQDNAIFPKDRAEQVVEAILDRIVHHCSLCELESDFDVKPKEIQTLEKETCKFHLCGNDTKKAGTWVQCTEPSEDGCRCDNDYYQW